MRVRGFPAFLLLCACAVFGSTFAPQLRILGGQPDLVVLFVLTWAVLDSFESGLLWAAVGGVLHDSLSAVPLGTTTLALIVVVFVLDRVRSQIVSIGLITVLGTVVAGTLVHKAVVLGVLAVSGFSIAPAEQLTYHIIPSLGFNLVLAIPAYWLSRRFFMRPPTLAR